MQNICDQKPKVRYLVALDDSKVKLKQITKAVSNENFGVWARFAFALNAKT